MDLQWPFKILLFSFSIPLRLFTLQLYLIAIPMKNNTTMEKENHFNTAIESFK